jgi:hypothetical protein
MTDTNAQPGGLASINAQIEAARLAAANAVQNAPATIAGPSGGAVVTQLVQPGRAISLGEALADTGMAVKAYLKIDKAGFMIGSDTKNFFDSIDVRFKLSDIMPFRGLRFGNPAQYLRSYDRLTESKTKKSWAQCIAEAQAKDDRCKGDYASADIPLIMVNDLVGTKGENKDKTLIAKGERLGLTLAVTNWKGFSTFIKPYEDLRLQGALPEDLMLAGKLVHEQKDNGTNVWGLATFVDFQAVPDQEDEVAQAA